MNKKFLFLLRLTLLLSSLSLLLGCDNSKYKAIGQEIVDGRISQIKKGPFSFTPTFIWVQTTTQTVQVEIPPHYENRWKVGDSCFLIIQKYKVID